MSEHHVWRHLSGLQVGRYAEHYVKMRFVLLGLEVYTPDVDDRGIDLVLRQGRGHGAPSYWDVQIKSLRLDRTNYVFLPKDKFIVRPNLLATVVVFREGYEPDLYLIPAEAWLDPMPPLSDRPYGQEGQTSKPEYGFSITAKHADAIERFRFSAKVQEIFSLSGSSIATGNPVDDLACP